MAIANPNEPWCLWHDVETLPGGLIKITREFDLTHPRCPVVAVSLNPFGVRKDAATVIETRVVTEQQFQELFETRH